MSFVECNPNHCPSIKSMGESLIKQELKIKELEQQKAELMEFIKNIEDTNLDELLDVKIPEILEKYTG